MTLAMSTEERERTGSVKEKGKSSRDTSLLHAKRKIVASDGSKKK